MMHERERGGGERGQEIWMSDFNVTPQRGKYHAMHSIVYILIIFVKETKVQLQLIKF